VYDDEEKSLIERYNLSLEQISWRRSKMAKIGRDKFFREFPSTLEEAYRMTGNTYFTADDLKYVDVLPVEATETPEFALFK
jgi:hypothetical protein